MSRFVAIASILLIVSLPLGAQVVQSPIYLHTGLGGGVSMPTGDLAGGHNTGWHAGGKVRLGGWIPVNLVAMGWYNSLPLKDGGNSDDQVMAGGGIEYSFTSLVVHPYIGADLMYVNHRSNVDGVPSIDRGAMGIGAGVEFAIPAFGSFDTSVKYQWLNMMGKDANEPDVTQVAATVVLMFDLL